MNPEFVFGDFFQRRIIIPVIFWVIYLTYGFIRGLKFDRKFLVNGFLAHLLFELGKFLATNTPGELHSTPFSIYCWVMALAWMGIILIYWDGIRLSKFDLRYTSLPLWILAISLVLRVIAAYRLSGLGLHTVLINSDDAQQYYGQALQLLSWHHIGPQYSIGESLFTAMLHFVALGNIRAMLLLQACLFSLCPALLFLVVKDIYGKKVAIVASAIMAGNQLMIFNSVNLTREGLGIFLTLFFLCTYQCSNIFSGVVGGLLILTDSLFLPILPLVCLYKKRYGVLFVAVSTLLFMNYIATGNVGLMTRDPGWMRMLFSSYGEAGMELTRSGLVPSDFFHGPITWIQNFFSSDYNITLFYRKYFLEFRRYFFEPGPGAFDPIALVKNSDLAANLYFYGYLAFLYGFFKALKRPNYVFLGIPVAHFLFYLIFFFCYSRFRAPMEPFWITFMALGITETSEVCG